MDDTRWKQRFANYQLALSQLEDACQKTSYTPLELAGLAQTFMFTFELAWKVLKDVLFYEGSQVGTPRMVIRQSFEAHYLSEDDCESFLDALENRNVLAHTYHKDFATQSERLIKQQYFPMLLRLRDTLNRKV